MEEITNQAEQPLAIMLPAWNEADVLIHSVKNMIDTIQYSNHHIFIGTCPNDSETQAHTDLLSSEFESVHKVVTPLPGPTCKADFLNSIIKEIKKYEQTSGICLGYILQDAEDVVHPQSLHVYNYFFLTMNWFRYRSSVYPADGTTGRGALHGRICRSSQQGDLQPSVYLRHRTWSRRWDSLFGAFDPVRGKGGGIFNTSSLTEDYDFSFRSKLPGFNQIFARVLIPREDKRFQAHPNSPKDYEIIATREYFPNVFWAAVRQKTRWFIGISLQGWELLGWRWSWRVKYMFWRDRKMLFFSHAIVAGLISFLIFMAFSCYHKNIHRPSVDRPDHWLGQNHSRISQALQATGALANARWIATALG